jgi:putative acetyltransferase
MIEAPPIEKLLEFQRKTIANDWPNYFAIEGGTRVVGWADVSVFANPRMAHRGGLGMGLRDGYRGRGLGTQLLARAVAHARRISLEKIELSVYVDNLPAVRLYERAGFERIGVIRNFRQLDGRRFDALMMELHLKP